MHTELDLIGIFAFGISGALMAIRRDFDVVGIAPRVAQNAMVLIRERSARGTGAPAGRIADVTCSRASPRLLVISVAWQTVF